ncbi:MAG: GNAT family N-acetyltransferase, partial [Balneolales bacterium]
QRIWWRHLNNHQQLHIITFRNNDQLIGIAPFYLEKSTLFYRFVFLTLKFIGCTGSGCANEINWTKPDAPYYLDVIVDPNYEDKIAEILLLYFEKAGDQFNQVDFDEVPDESFLMRKVVPRLAEKKWSFEMSQKNFNPRIKLPDSIEGLMLKSSATYDERNTQKSDSTELVIENAKTQDDVDLTFENLVLLQQTYWKQQPHCEMITEQKYTHYLKEVMDTFFRKGWIKINTARSYNNCIAVDLSFIYNSRVYDFLRVLDNELTLSRYDAGKSLTYNLLVEAINFKSKVIDLQSGDEYKAFIADDHYATWQINIPHTKERKGMKYKLYKLLYLSKKKLRNQNV